MIDLLYLGPESWLHIRRWPDCPDLPDADVRTNHRSIRSAYALCDCHWSHLRPRPCPPAIYAGPSAISVSRQCKQAWERDSLSLSVRDRLITSSVALSMNALPFLVSIPLLVPDQKLFGTAFGLWYAFQQAGQVITDVSAGAIQDRTPGGG